MDPHPGTNPRPSHSPVRGWNGRGRRRRREKGGEGALLQCAAIDTIIIEGDIFVIKRFSLVTLMQQKLNCQNVYIFYDV